MQQQPPPPPPRYSMPPYSQPPQQQQPQLPPVGAVIDKGAERTLSVLAHGAIAFGFFGIGFLMSMAIAGVIWLYAKRSPEVRFHSEQAGCYQCIVLLINIVWVVLLAVGSGFTVFSIFTGGSTDMAGWVGFGLIAFVIWFFASILYGIFAAVMVLMGKRFKYPILGDRFERRAL